MALLLIGSLLVHQFVPVRAQLYFPACLQNTTYNWLFNQEGQSPCQIAATLEGACTDNSWEVSGLQPGGYYTISEEWASVCSCDNAVYNLLAGCQYCQNVGDAWETWSTWTTACVAAGATITSSGWPSTMPLPAGVTIPQWAMIDTSDGTWNPAAASALAASGLPDYSQTSSSSQTTRTSTSSSSSSTSTSTSSSSSASPTPTQSPAPLPAGAIAGGVVGGVAVICACVILIVWMFIRDRRKRTDARVATETVAQQQALLSPTGGYNPSSPESRFSNPSQRVVSTIPSASGQSVQRDPSPNDNGEPVTYAQPPYNQYSPTGQLYDPRDPNTWPPDFRRS